MKSVIFSVAVVVCCGFAGQAEASYIFAGYMGDAGCGCEAAPSCDSCGDVWSGYCGRKHRFCKPLRRCCKPVCQPICCEPAPVCEPTCCEPTPCCKPRHRCRLFHGLKRCCKPACEPACGAEPTCGYSVEPSCGVEGGVIESYDEAPEAPTPAEPQAFRGVRAFGFVR